MELNAIFTDNTVFAVNKPIRVFGTGNGVAEITFKGITKKAVGKDGKWLVSFEPEPYGGPYELSANLDGKTVLLKNIYVGDVYLAAGQSNMQFKLKESATEPKNYETNPNCRFFSTKRLENAEYFLPENGWVICDKQTAGEWSAIGYHVANGVEKRKNVAVGIISCYQGASVIESWLPKEKNQKFASLITDKKHFDHYFETYAVWNGDGVLYEYTLEKQILPFSVSGVVYYQGESDTCGQESLMYKDELKELISSWRKAFDDDKLPFVIVQLANFLSRADTDWENVQNAQWNVQFELPLVKTVVAKDVCENNDIHPRTKEGVSARIVDALLAFSD